MRKIARSGSTFSMETRHSHCEQQVGICCEEQNCRATCCTVFFKIGTHTMMDQNRYVANKAHLSLFFFQMFRSQHAVQSSYSWTDFAHIHTFRKMDPVDGVGIEIRPKFVYI